MPESYLYVFVRQDISLPQQTVQAVHAIFAMATLYKCEYSANTNVILIGVPDLRSLKRVSAKLKTNQIPHYEWTEPDEPQGFNSIATAPLFRDQREVLANYRLYRCGEAAMSNATRDERAQGFDHGHGPGAQVAATHASTPEPAQADLQPEG